MTARIYFIIFLLIAALVAVVLIIIFLLGTSTSTVVKITPPPASSSNAVIKSIDNTGYFFSSGQGNFAIIVVKFIDFRIKNGDYLLQAQTSDSSPVKDIAITLNSKINISYYKDKTKDVSPNSDQTTLIPINKENDLINLLTRLKGKNLILSFFLDSPINNNLLPKDVLTCNSSNINATVIFRASCIPFTQVFSSYEP